MGSSDPQRPVTPQKSPPPVTWMSLPKKDQLAILALVRVVDFFQVACLQAYMFHQLKSFAPDLTDSKISFQAGVMQGGFTSAQTITAILWGRIADASWSGRKRVILIGLLGTGISCVGVGYSRSFVEACAWRIFGGAVNGTVGAARTMIAEAVDKRYHARAFLLLPAAFNVANILGPILGGLLADPIQQYPGIFSEDSWISKSALYSWLTNYPYAAPNILSAFLLFLEAALVWLGLHETLASRKGCRDRGTELTAMVRSLWRRIPFTRNAGYSLVDSQEKSWDPIQEGELGNAEPTQIIRAPARPVVRQRLPFHRMWTKNVIMVLLTTAIFDFQMGAFASLWVIHLSAPRSESQAHSLVTFTGGLSFPPSKIGFAMSLLGIIGIILQFMLYPSVNAKFGLLRSFRYSLYLFPIAYFLAPYLSLLPSSTPAPEQASGFLVWFGIAVILFLQVAARTFALPATIILLNNCSPHPSVLGTIHGLGSSTSSTFRTIGPIVAGKWYAIGLQKGMVETAWWGVSVVSALGVLFAYFVRNGSGHEIKLPGEEEEEMIMIGKRETVTERRGN